MLGGYLTHFFSENWRPRRINAYSIVQIRAEVGTYLSNTVDAERVRKLIEIQRLVDLAERLNSLGQASDARTQLEKAQQLLDEYRKSEDVKAQALKAQVRQPYIEVRDHSLTTDTVAGFHVVNADLQEDDKIRWYFGDGTAPVVSSVAVLHRFARRGEYGVKAEILHGKDQKSTGYMSEQVVIFPGRAETELAVLARDIQTVDVALSVVALALACLGGLAYLYVGKTFGTLADYITAVTWGFGLDNSVRGFSTILKKITTN